MLAIMIPVFEKSQHGMRCFVVGALGEYLQKQMFRLAASLLKLELRSAFERRQVGGIQLESVLEGTQPPGVSPFPAYSLPPHPHRPLSSGVLFSAASARLSA